ncbi:hypothetical protein GLW20_08650 [Virgibacillus halodenitrificans]|nr:hypothetical protein [Virgibacillus halodenitrificans]
MKKITSFVGSLLLILFFGVSVSAEESLDKVYIDSEETFTIEPGKEYILDNGIIITPLDKDVADKLVGKNKSSQEYGTFGAGEWDLLGTSTFKTTSKVFNSGGGDLVIYFDHPAWHRIVPYRYALREKDGPIYTTLANFKLEGGYVPLQFNVRGYTDGDNRKAELYLYKFNYITKAVWTQWYD